MDKGDALVGCSIMWHGQGVLAPNLAQVTRSQSEHQNDLSKVLAAPVSSTVHVHESLKSYGYLEL